MRPGGTRRPTSMNPYQTLHDLVHPATGRDEHAAALVAPSREVLSYEALRRQMMATVAALRRANVGRLDRVALVLPNGPEMAAASVAIASGAVCAPLNPAYGEEEFRFFLKDLQPAAILLPADDRGSARTVAKSLGVRCLDARWENDWPAGTIAIDGGPAPAHRDEDPPHPDDVALVLHTSGTVSRPKLVPLSHRNLCRSASNIVETLCLSPRDRCLNVMPLFHIHGFVAALLASLAAGGSIACCPGYRDGRFLPWLRTLRPSWYTAAPAVHQAILVELARLPDGVAANRLRFARSSSAALPPAVLHALESALQAPVIEAYGMTEAAHQIASNPLPPGERRAGSVGLAAGPSVAIMDDEQHILPAGEPGEIVIRGDNVTVGYAAPPEANEEAFAAGWFRTGDQGFIDTAGYIHITGRLKEIINRGGEKVSPVEVDEALLEHAAVRMAVTFAVRHVTLGEDIAAAVVLHDGATATADEIRASLFGRLAESKIPSRLVVVDAIPSGATGKISRIGLDAKLAAQLRPAFVAPRNGGERAVATLFREVLGEATIGAFDNFFALGGDSLRALQLLARIRAQWHIDVPVVDLFKEPTVAQLAETVTRARKAAERAALGPDESAPLAHPPATRSRLPPVRPLLRTTRHKDIVELSFAQQRLWLLDRLLPGGSVYNAGLSVQLAGSLDVEALRAALNEVVRRHDVLRARFALVEGSPVELIAAELTVSLIMEDLGDLPDGNRQEEARRRMREEMRAPFDLERGPLVRARLLRLDAQAHWLSLTLHHIVTDGWSSRVLARELSVLYRAYRRHEPSPLPELPVQYADYAVWQREWLQGAKLDAEVNFWKHALAQLPELELPTDHRRPPVTSYRGASVAFVIGDELTSALKELGRREEATLFMTLLAAFHVLLYRYCGQEDIAVGVPIAGRLRPELEGLIGFFVNTLVLRGDLSGEQKYREYLGHVRERALDAYVHQELPFEKLVEELAPKRDLSRNPLVQVTLNMINLPDMELRLEGLTVEPAPESSASVKFDLTLRVKEVSGRLHSAFEYSTDLFDRTTIVRLVGHWRVLLEGIVADPARTISRLPLLTEAERHQALSGWNADTVDHSRNLCIHTLFEAQAARTPDAVATIFMAQHLTYRELDARANRVAHRLRALGVGPDARVAVAMERSSELVVALLGILKAGGAYVPLDPSHPAERLAFMLEDTSATVLLTQHRWLPRLWGATGQILCLDRDWPAIAEEPESRPQCAAGASNLAYVIYTSGSTGQPKGVMVEHRGVCSHLQGFVQVYGLSPDDRVLLSAPIGFDLSLWQMLLPLIAGAAIVLPEPEAHRSGDRLVTLIRRERVTLLRMVPGMLSAIVNAPGFGECASLRLVISAGEVLDGELARRFHASSNAMLCNAYGPTETTFFTTLWTCRRDDTWSRIPIGRPFANARVYLLDAQGEPVPIGTHAEIFIGGVGVARGYLNSAEANAERFIADPFAGTPQARMYRTGDIARHRPDGTLEFLGRRDHQVKLRGVRIELGEIEAVLARQGGVREAVAALREDMPGHPQLVAYVVPRGDPPATADLRAFAKRFLPDAMLPAAFVVLPELPLTANGKLDRNALPAPAFEHRGRGQGAPDTPLERALAELMAEVLNLDRVGTDDNFFDLGGHSLLAVRLMNRIRFDLQIDLSLRQLFDAPTVRGLALAVQHQPVAIDDL